MADNYQALLVDNLDVIERIVRFVAHKRRLSSADRDEFASLVRFRLVDRDFAILRKFQGRSALSTYLTVVIDRLCVDFCRTRTGKWRPSAPARRLGAVARLLEQLVVRDEVTFEEAVGTLQTNHGITKTREELHDIFMQLPRRTARSANGGPLAPSAIDHGVGIQSIIEHHDERAALARIEAALAEAIAALDDEDRLLLKLRFEDGLSVARIASTLGLQTKPLYVRLKRVLETLKADLQREGIEQSEIARLIGHPALPLDGVLAGTRGGFGR